MPHLSVVGADSLLERDAELRAVERAMAEAAGGAGHVLVVEGPAGIGKSRLLGEARTRGLAHGMRVAVARGSEFEAEHGYGVIRQLLEPPLARADPDTCARLLAGAAAPAARIFGELCDVETPAGEDVSFATLHALYWVAVNLAEELGPLALVVDDLQWADEPSQRALAYLARRIEGSPIALVAAVRTGGELGPELAGLTADPAAVVLRPRPLTEAAGRSVVRDMAGADAAEEFAAAVHEATGGNPLLLRELVCALRDEGVAPDAAGAARAREIAPEAVTRAVGLRLARLGEDARSLASSVAVIGSQAPLACLADLSGLPAEAIAPTAETLAAAGILRPGGALEFAHPVIGAAVYERLPLAERHERHAKAVVRLAVAGAPAHRIAAHALRTPPAGRAETVEVLREAARHAQRASAPLEAVTYLRRALEEPPPADERVDLLVELGECELFAGLPEGVARLRDVLAEITDPARRAAVEHALGRAHFWRGELEPAVRHLESAMAAVHEDDVLTRRRYEAELISTMHREPSLQAEAMERLAGVADEELADDVGSRMLLACRAWLETARGRDRELAVSLARRALADDTLLDAQDTWTFLSATYVLAFADHLDEACRYSDAAVRRAQAAGDPAAFARASWFCGYVDFMRGALVEAEAHLRAALTSLAGREVFFRPFVDGMLAQVLAERGAAEEARMILPADDAPGAYASSPRLRARARVNIALGHPERAVDDLREAARQLGEIGARNPAMSGWRSELAVPLLARGEEAEARRLADEEVGLARAWGAGRALGRALRGAGLAHGGAEGLALLEESVAVLMESPAALERAMSLVELGAALRRGNQRAVSREPLRAGMDLAQRCGALPLAQRAHQELLATGARPRRLVLTGAESLTASEDRVARMAARGMTNRDIAQALFVTPRTVEMHLSNVFRKLDIRSRTQIAGRLVSDERAA